MMGEGVREIVLDKFKLKSRFCKPLHILNVDFLSEKMMAETTSKHTIYLNPTKTRYTAPALLRKAVRLPRSLF